MGLPFYKPVKVAEDPAAHISKNMPNVSLRGKGVRFIIEEVKEHMTVGVFAPKTSDFDINGEPHNTNGFRLALVAVIGGMVALFVCYLRY